MDYDVNLKLSILQPEEAMNAYKSCIYDVCVIFVSKICYVRKQVKFT